MRITVSITVDRPVRDAWRWYAVDHVRNHPRWDPELELEHTAGGPIGLGSRIRRRNRHFGQPIDGEMEIVEWEPERVMGAQIHDANLDTIGRATFEAIGPSRTQITLDADFPGMDQAAEDVIRPRMERTARKIRELMESDV